MSTDVLATEVLLAAFGSVVAVATEALFAMVAPLAVLELTCTTSVKLTEPGASAALPQLTVPPAPAAGVVHDQPAGDVRETNVVPEGRVSVSVALWAA
ncbi:MAG TPA: hypothetical protein VKH17_10340, partial [Acidimicrobiia bacterium]|nr:hypothetical protein [Acidimicrobiia bacterium]